MKVLLYANFDTKKRLEEAKTVNCTKAITDF